MAGGAGTRASPRTTPGMLPAFKETVEELFVRGLVKAVFATETLALGINMPARTVVLERLVKYNGEAHVDLTAGEYTQLTGRAGRRGIDVEGHAVVVWQPGMDPRQVAGLASTRTYPLRSSFRPGYNMAVNLVGRVGAAAARDAARAVLRAVPGRPLGGGMARPGRPQHRGACAATPRQCVCDRGLRRVRPVAAEDLRTGGRWPGRTRRAPGAETAKSWRNSGKVTSSSCRRVAGRDWPWSSTR